MNVVPIVLVALLAPFSGCLDFDREQRYGGVSLDMHPEYAGDVYVKVWSNSNPERAEEGRPFQAVYNCVREGDTSQENYVMDENWFRVSVHELVAGPFGDEAGDQLDSKRWDGLRCFVGYTLIITAAGELELFRCSQCERPEDREGVEPLMPSDG